MPSPLITNHCTSSPKLGLSVTTSVQINELFEGSMRQSL